MGRFGIYKKWKEGARPTEQQVEMAQRDAIKRNNMATIAAVVGTPLIASRLADPYILSQLYKFAIPTAAYATANSASQKMGYESVEDGVVQNVFGNNLSEDAKNGIATALAFTPFSISKSAPTITKTLGELTDDFYKGAKNAYDHYAPRLNSFSTRQRIKNKNFDKQQRFVPEMFKRESIVHIPEEKGHTYKFFVDPKNMETSVHLKTFSGKDMGYAGNKAGSEIALMNAIGNSDPRSVFIPRHHQMLMKSDDNFNNMASLMALKRNLGIEGAFENISDQDVQKVFRLGWDKGLWAPKRTPGQFGSSVSETVGEFWKRNQNNIKGLIKSVPVITGAGVLSTQNEKGDQ